MSGKQAKRDRKVAKMGAEILMKRVREQWGDVIKPRSRFMPAWIYRRMLKAVINIDRIPQ